MNSSYPPLTLLQPEIAVRRKEKNRPVPTPPEVVARRREIALRIRQQLQPLEERLQNVTDVERKEIFYKLEHEGPISLDRTGLKPITEPTEHFTIAVPRTDNLGQFRQRIEEFEGGEIKYGMLPNAQLSRIQNIAQGQPKDRLSQELFDNYDALVLQDLVVCEIEMLSLALGRNQRRDHLQSIRHALMAELGAQGTLFEHEEIRGTCRAVIRCTGPTFRRLVEQPEWQTRITWFENRPEFQTFHKIVQDFDVSALGMISPPTETAPLVCIVDTGVTSGNAFIQPILKQELVKSFLQSRPDDGSDEYGHGSGVASLVSYYALNLAAGSSNAGKVWICSARVLNENNEAEDRLFSRVLQEVVDFFVPLGVKIFNLSVNTRNQPWNLNAKRTVPRRSWTARKIDHLSREKDIVFVISTGNLTPLDVRHFIEDGKPYPLYFSSDESRILDPGQAALALTVGSIAPTTLAVGAVGRARAIAMTGQPSPFTRTGPGVNNEIKPELVEFGGNYLLDEEGIIVRNNLGSSVAAASHQLSPAVAYHAGTSFASPRAAHKLASVQADLKSIDVEPSAALLKAFLVNSGQYELTEEDLGEFSGLIAASGTKNWLNVLGYGKPDATRATYCGPHEVILYYDGEIASNAIVIFDVPVPGILVEADGRKRLTVTVAYTPEVQRWGLEQYLGTVLKWRMFRGDVSRDEIVNAMSHSEEEDTIQPDIPNEL
jgi:hypothetical protein